ncbi:MAG: hypothetical protein ACYDDA_02405 [Acidiferrobacteraceae bacterium]
MEAQTSDAGRGRHWVAGGWVLFSRDRALWFGMALVYLAIAVVLNEIPFIGYLLIVWITPLFAAGALATAKDLESRDVHAPTFPGGALRDSLRRAFGSSVAALFQTFWQPEKTLAVMITGTMALGGAVVLQILGELFGIGAPTIPAMITSGVGFVIWGPAVLGLVVIWALRLALILVTLYTVHLVVLDNQMSLPAIEHSVYALGRHAVPVALFGTVFLVPMLASRYLGLPGTLLVNTLMLPLFLTSLYESHKDLYA